MESVTLGPTALWSRSTLNKFSSSVLIKEEKIITGSVESSPKVAYLKWDGSSLSSRLGGFCIEGTSVDNKCFSSTNSSSFENLVVGSKYPMHSRLAWSFIFLMSKWVMHASNGYMRCPSRNISLVSLSTASMQKQSSLSIGYIIA